MYYRLSVVTARDNSLFRAHISRGFFVFPLKFMKVLIWGFPCGSVVKNPSTNAGDIRGTSSILGLGISPGRGHGNLLQYFCLENPMERGAWWATAHKVAKSWTQLKQLSMYARVNTYRLLNFLYLVH